MKKFKDKKQVLEYIKRIAKGRVILIRGSTANKPVKNFSDFDVEVYGNKLKKPCYEIIFLGEKIVLISIYYYKYKIGREIKLPKNVKVIYGKYNDKLIPNFIKDKYTPKQKIKRECQMLIDFMFKYLRTKDKKYLKSVIKRLK
jgi:hypothetical protein